MYQRLLAILLLVSSSLLIFGQVAAPLPLATQMLPTALDRLADRVNELDSWPANLRFDTQEIPIDFEEYFEYWGEGRFVISPDTPIATPFLVQFDQTVVSLPIRHKPVVTSRYGWRWGRPHRGIDIDLHTGDTVCSVIDGIVRLIGYDSYHGHYVIVRHNHGLETTYSHLSKIHVTRNQFIRSGESVGLGGATGNARGSHLHFEIRYHGKSINPEYVFDFQESKVRAESFWVTNYWVNPIKHNSRRASRVAVIHSLDQATESQKNETKVHVVRNGDTLWGIARRYGARIGDICKDNSISKSTVLKIGQRLLVK